MYTAMGGLKLARIVVRRRQVDKIGPRDFACAIALYQADFAYALTRIHLRSPEELRSEEDNPCDTNGDSLATHFE